MIRPRLPTSSSRGSHGHGHWKVPSCPLVPLPWSAILDSWVRVYLQLATALAKEELDRPKVFSIDADMTVELGPGARVSRSHPIAQPDDMCT